MAYYNKSPQNNGDGKNAEDRALDTFANMMIEKIESLGSKDGWQKPWFTEGTLSWPKNLSGREYNVTIPSTPYFIKPSLFRTLQFKTTKSSKNV